MYAKADSGARLEGASAGVLAQADNFRKSCLGACTEVVSFYFEVLEPELFSKYQQVSQELDRRGDQSIIFKTRRDIDPFSVQEVLVDVHTTEHKDASDWIHGFVGMVPSETLLARSYFSENLASRLRQDLDASSWYAPRSTTFDNYA